MPQIKLPISQGLIKASDDIEYMSTTPVNMLAVPKEVLNASGYMRSYPGLTLYKDVKGISRGVQFNTARNTVFRVIGTTIYENDEVFATLDLGAAVDARVSMAHSDVSQAIAVGGTARLYRYDGTNKTLSAWPASSGYVTTGVGVVSDIVRNKGRYIWSQEGTQLFGVTDLEDESKPDRYRPFVRAESQPDGIVGLGTWKEYVIAFGSATIEYFELTGYTDGSQPVYQANPSLMIGKGIAGKFAKSPFMESFAILTGPSNGQPGVYVLGVGQLQKISTASIDRMIESYTAEQLKQVVMESYRFRGHEFLIVHLPDRTLCFDGSSTQNGPQWCLLQTGHEYGPHRAIDYCFDGKKVTVADKLGDRWGLVDNSVSSQYGEQQEHVLFTPMLKADNAFLFDMELEASTGRTGLIETILVSATQDGINYGPEYEVGRNVPLDYNRRVIKQKIGRVRKNIGFKFRCLATGPITLSDLSLRVEQ